MVESDKAEPKEGRRMLRGGGRHTELGDNGFSSEIPSLKSCFETWSRGKDFFISPQGFIVYCHSCISPGNTWNSRTMTFTQLLCTQCLRSASKAEHAPNQLKSSCSIPVVVWVVCVPQGDSPLYVGHLSRTWSRDRVYGTLRTLPGAWMLFLL